MKRKCILLKFTFGFLSNIDLVYGTVNHSSNLQTPHLVFEIHICILKNTFVFQKTHIENPHLLLVSLNVHF